ncbi:MAG: DUF2024 family protein [Cyclobacteriaceae bacterium]|nr:DUF2024 family protein [Cyclobacteriaceae bacterium]
MKVAVWDTYVTKADGVIMNFDIIVPESETDPEIIYGYGQDYLKSKAIQNYPITSNHCTFCHIETATEVMLANIKQKGYSIIELKNCE